MTDEDDSWFGGYAEHRAQEAAVERPQDRVGRFARGPLRPLARLVGALVVAIVAIVALVAAVGGSDERADTRGYLAALMTPAADSQALGRQLDQLLHGPAVNERQFEAKIGSLIQQQQQAGVTVQRLSVGPHLYGIQQNASAVFALRLAGLQGVLSTARTAGKAKDLVRAGEALAAFEQRLVTSDVVWNDLVRTPLLGLAGRERLAAALVPESQLVRNPDLVSPQVATQLLQRLNSVSRGGATPVSAPLKLGDHGAAVASWQAQLNAWLKKTSPNSKPLTTDGIFGTGTQLATEALQRSAGITPDGTIGPVTRRALARALGKNG